MNIVPRVPAETRIWLAAGITDMRRGFGGLSVLVQNTLEENPLSGHIFVFRGRRGDLIKLLWWDGDGLCLLAKRLERGRFIWPKVEICNSGKRAKNAYTMFAMNATYCSRYKGSHASASLPCGFLLTDRRGRQGIDWRRCPRRSA